LTVKNDFDSQGLAVTDEFSDAIAACIIDGFDGRIRKASITEIRSSLGGGVRGC